MSLTISEAAIQFIVAEEDSDKAYYNKHYQHFDWPGGSSGPTIGIGYDCGYCTASEARRDWSGIVDDATVEAIVRACGKHGPAGHSFVQSHKTSVTVTWDQAMREFREREVPKWIGRVTAALPNCDKLSPDALGALVSLAYNRGCSFNLSGSRYTEMRAIKQHMRDGLFSRIPGDILAMQRLWPHGSDLWRRRAHEADLFRKGLAHATSEEEPVEHEEHPESREPQEDSGRPVERFEEEPEGKGMHRSKTGWAAILATVTSVGAAVGQAMDSLRPLLEDPRMVAVLVAVGLATGAFIWWDRRSKMLKYGV